MTRGGGRFDFEEHLLSDVHDLPPLARLVGMTLATFADGTSCDLGKHSPSFAVLKKRAGISNSSVARQLDQLEVAGWVARHRPTVADARLKHARTRYRLAVPTRVRDALAAAKAGPTRGLAPGEAGPTVGPGLVPHGDLAGPTVGLTTTETTVTTTNQLDRHEIALKVAEGLAKKPGIEITTGWALRVVNEVLGKATGTVANPVGYVLAVVRKNPSLYRPTNGPPPWAQVKAELRGDVA